MEVVPINSRADPGQGIPNEHGSSRTTSAFVFVKLSRFAELSISVHMARAHQWCLIYRLEVTGSSLQAELRDRNRQISPKMWSDGIPPMTTSKIGI